MKKVYMFIILTSAILGIFIGSMIKDTASDNAVYGNKDKVVKSQIKEKKKSVRALQEEKGKLDDQVEELSKNFKSSDEAKDINSLEENLSYTDLEGSGIIMTVDAIDEKEGNLSNLVDYNRILLNIVNELKSEGADFVSINDQRINQYSEIALAGSHININGTPVAQPYVIKAIGDHKKLSSYMEQGSEYLNRIQLKNPIKINIKFDKKIHMKKTNLPNNLKYIEGE
jgi:uncharacterized protein YlxW (UPF0749 family)